MLPGTPLSLVYLFVERADLRRRRRSRRGRPGRRSAAAAALSCPRTPSGADASHKLGVVAIDPEEYRRIVSRFATGVTIATTVDAVRAHRHADRERVHVGLARPGAGPAVRAAQRRLPRRRAGQRRLGGLDPRRASTRRCPASTPARSGTNWTTRSKASPTFAGAATGVTLIGRRRRHAGVPDDGRLSRRGPHAAARHRRERRVAEPGRRPAGLLRGDLPLAVRRAARRSPTAGPADRRDRIAPAPDDADRPDGSCSAGVSAAGESGLGRGGPHSAPPGSAGLAGSGSSGISASSKARWRRRRDRSSAGRRGSSTTPCRDT